MEASSELSDQPEEKSAKAAKGRSEAKKPEKDKGYNKPSYSAKRIFVN